MLRSSLVPTIDYKCRFTARLEDHFAPTTWGEITLRAGGLETEGPRHVTIQVTSQFRFA